MNPKDLCSDQLHALEGRMDALRRAPLLRFFLNTGRTFYETDARVDRDFLP
jgi:hypothetical protein